MSEINIVGLVLLIISMFFGLYLLVIYIHFYQFLKTNKDLRVFEIQEKMMKQLKTAIITIILFSICALTGTVLFRV